MIAKVVRIDFEIIAKVWDTRGSGNVSHSVSVNRYSYGLIYFEDFRYGVEFSAIVNETNACITY